MRHRKHTFKVGRNSGHRSALVANLACSLIIAPKNRIRTTLVKAKELRRVADRLVSLGKSGTLHDRRRAISIIRNKDAVAELFSNVAPRFQNRDGGYTRIVKLGPRRGDAAEMCFIEYLPEGDVQKGSEAAASTTDEVAE